MATNPVPQMRDPDMLARGILAEVRSAGFRASLVESKSRKVNDNWRGSRSDSRYVKIWHGDREWTVRVSLHEVSSKSIRQHGRPDLDLMLPLSASYIRLTIDGFIGWISQHKEKTK